jgi:hypothetical protein
MLRRKITSVAMTMVLTGRSLHREWDGGNAQYYPFNMLFGT